MKRHYFLRVFALLITITLMLSGITIAAETAEVVFEATEKDAAVIELSATVKNVAFRGLQVAVRYDKGVLTPIDEFGNDAKTFDEFSTRDAAASLFETVGLVLDADKGLFGFTVFIMPGTTGEKISSLGEFVADETGVTLFKFRFKKKMDGDPAFEIAFEDVQKPYQAALEEGFIMSNSLGKPETTITFSNVEKETQSSVVVQKPKEFLTEEPQLTSVERKKDVICLQIGKSRAVSNGKKTVIDANNSEVVPYISNDRTMVPIRFVAESLGAEVLWEEGWKYCIIKSDDTEIKLNFNSAEFEVNGEKLTFDAPVEITQDRTMVPIRFVSEQLGRDVYWNERNSAVVIAPKDNPWQEDRKAEITALNEMIITILGIVS